MRLSSAECDDGSSLDKCNQVVAIAKATGKEGCPLRRDFYDCMRIEGCYFLPEGCKRDDGTPISCSEQCENEPFFMTCRDDVVRESPEEDFHLCPHITKAMMSTPAPTEEDFKGAPAIPFTLSAWTSFYREAGSAQVTNVVPPIWPNALRAVISKIFDVHPLAVVVEMPLSHRSYISAFPRSRQPFEEAEETTFMVFYVHVMDETKVSSTRAMLDTALVGETGILPTNVSAVEEGLFMALNSSIPQGSGLMLKQLQLYFISGKETRFPATTTTTTLTTTSTVDAFLTLQQYRAWRLRCMVGVVFRWDIEEVIFWADKCPWRFGKQRLWPMNLSENESLSNANLTADSSGDLTDRHGLTPVSSGDLTDRHGATLPCCVARKGFDGDAYGDFDEGTAWVSGCMACKPGEAWLGLDGGGHKFFSVACVEFQQGRDVTNQCEKTVVEASMDMVTWEWRAEILGFGADKFTCIPRTRNDYPLLECGGLDDGCDERIDFGTCPGYQEVCEQNRCRCTGGATKFDLRFRDFDCGTADDGCNQTLDFGECTGYNATCDNNRCKDTGSKASMWRLLCEAGTIGRWWVKEVEFHAEGLCLNALDQYRSTISSGSYDGQNSEANAFDSNPNTMWMSDCQFCRPNQAWIGIDFGSQIRVACVRLVQHPNTVQQCTRLILEYSDDAIFWKERSRYGFGAYTLNAEEDLTADIDSLVSDEDLFPPERKAVFWRMACVETLRHQWGIFELDFYDDEECKNSLRRSTKDIVHSRSSSWAPRNAFDYQSETLWLSGCGRCYNDGTECDPCNQGKAYLGLEFKKTTIVKCVKIQQLDPDHGGCSKIRLQFSMTGIGTDWKIRDTFEDVGPFAYLKPYQTATDVGHAATQHPLGLCGIAIGLLSLRHVSLFLRGLE